MKGMSGGMVGGSKPRKPRSQKSSFQKIGKSFSFPKLRKIPNLLGKT